MTVSEVVLVVMTGQDILQRENEKSGTVHVTEQPGQRQAQPAVEGTLGPGRANWAQEGKAGVARARLPDPEQILRDLALRGHTLPTVPEQAYWRV